MILVAIIRDHGIYAEDIQALPEIKVNKNPASAVIFHFDGLDN